jgi:hypothetical protein
MVLKSTLRRVTLKRRQNISKKIFRYVFVSEGFCSCVEIRQFFPCGGGEKELGEAEENWTNSLLQRWNS